MVNLPLSLIVAHYVGDWLLQTNWQALNKSKNNEALFAHVFVYSLCFAFWGYTFAYITFCLHFLTDYVTSRIGAKLWFIELDGAYAPNLFDFAKVDMKKRKWFWVMIGTDQLIHFVTLALTYKLVFGG